MNNQDVPLDLTSVRAFDAVATHLSFRKAALAVALSPAALSTRVRALEDELGTQLFVRTTRRVQLTAAGLRVQQAARETLASAHALRAAASSTTKRTYALTLGTRFELGLSWIVPQLASLERAHPERTVHLAFGDGPALLAQVEGGVLDAAVTSARFSSTTFASLPLHQEAYVFVGQSQLLTRTPLVRAQDAAHHRLLDADAALPLFRYFRDASPAEEQWAFSSVAYLGTTAALRARVLEGAGVAVLPRYLVADDLRRGTLRPLFRSRRIPLDWFRFVFRADHPRQEQLALLAAEMKRARLR